MEWHKIVGFYHVAKIGSFTKAAEATFITQSALTQQIKALEEELGCQLFERIGKRKLLLTPAGEKLLKFAETTLTKYDCLLENLNEFKRLKKGYLRIAAPFTTLYHLLPKTLEIYTKQFSWIELTLLDRPHAKIIELVRNGDIDFGITLESLVSNNFNKIRWKRVDPVLLTPRRHPLTEVEEVSMREIVKYPLILPPKGTEYSYRKRLEELFQLQNLNYRVIVESSNVELSALYVEHGLGISFATIDKDQLPALKQRKLEFISLSHYFEPGYIAVVFRKDKVISSLKEEFLNILLSSYL